MNVLSQSGQANDLHSRDMPDDNDYTRRWSEMFCELSPTQIFFKKPITLSRFCLVLLIERDRLSAYVDVGSYLDVGDGDAVGQFLRMSSIG